MVNSVLYFIQFAFFFLLYLVFIPAKLMGRPLWGENAGENALKALIASYVVVISCVYLLGLLHIYNTVTLVIALLTVALVYLKLVKHVSYRDAAQSALRWLALVGSGQYKLGLLAKQAVRRRMQSCKAALQDKKWRLSPTQAAACLVALVALGGLIWYKWPLVFDNYAYLTSDMYVHHEWVNWMEQGDIFYNGVYPFGLHNMLSAFHKLTGLHLNVIFRYWGAVNCLLLAVMLWFFARRVFRSRMAAALAVVIYCVSDFTGYDFGYRAIYTLPQELGMLFLFPCVYFLGKFLQDKKREDGLYFVFSASLTLSMHFYTVIMAVLLCACCCVAFIRTVLKPDMIKRLALCVALIAALSILPLILGLASGKQWQGSMLWAMSVINGSTSQSAEPAPTEEPEESGQTAPEEVEPEKAQSASGPAEKLLELGRLLINDMNSHWGYVFWAGMGLFAVFWVVMALRKALAFEERMCAGIWLFLLVLTVMYGSYILGFPQLMQQRRVSMFLGYTAPLLLVFPLELLYRILPGRADAVGSFSALAASAALFYASVQLGYFPAQTYYYLEHSLAARACVQAEREFPRGTWTVVSPVEELSMVRNAGYHYELWEFITGMERYQEDMHLEIPTDHIFFVLEKNPLDYNQIRETGLEYPLEAVSDSDAACIVTREMLGIPQYGEMKYYNNLENRRALEAKLACWLEEYSRAFPDQMEVYLEDEECVVYKFEQDLFMPNNFAIDYGYNVISELDYYEQLRDRMLEREQDTTEVDEKLAQLRAEEG